MGPVPVIPKQRLGLALRALRRIAGLTQAQASELLGEVLGRKAPATSTVSSWERGETEPAASQLLALLSVFGQDLISLQDALEGRKPGSTRAAVEELRVVAEQLGWDVSGFGKRVGGLEQRLDRMETEP